MFRIKSKLSLWLIRSYMIVPLCPSHGTLWPEQYSFCPWNIINSFMSQYHCKYVTSARLEFSFLAWLLFVIEFKYQSSFWTIFPKKKLYPKSSPSTKRNSELLGMMGMFIILIKVMVSWIYTHEKVVKLYIINTCVFIIVYHNYVYKVFFN